LIVGWLARNWRSVLFPTPLVLTAIIEAASNLARTGQLPSVAEAADAALVSKATACASPMWDLPG
jgi:hypothetical protein